MVWVTPAVTRVSSASTAVSREPEPDTFVWSAPTREGPAPGRVPADRTDNLLTNVLLAGLSPNAVLRGIDFRPSNGLLYGVAEVGGAAELYLIDHHTNPVRRTGSTPVVVPPTGRLHPGDQASDRVEVIAHSHQAGAERLNERRARTAEWVQHRSGRCEEVSPRLIVTLRPMMQRLEVRRAPARPRRAPRLEMAPRYQPEGPQERAGG